MATIKSGVTADILTVDPTSKAARVSLYDPAGNSVYPQYSGSYAARMDTGSMTAVANGVFWSLRNTGTKTCFIRTIQFTGGYVGAVAAAPQTLTRTVMKLEKFSGATPTAGTSYGVAKRYTTAGASSVSDVRGGASLTTTGATADAAAIASVGIVCAGMTGSVSGQIDLDGGGEEGRVQLAVGEGLWLRCDGTPVAGSWMCGAVIWEER